METNFGDINTRWDRLYPNLWKKLMTKFLGAVVIAGLFTLSLLVVTTIISNWKTAQLEAAAVHSFKPVH